MFGSQFAKYSGCKEMIEWFLHILPFRENERFLWRAGWGEKHNRIFRGTERIPNDVFPLSGFYVSLWMLVS